MDGETDRDELGTGSAREPKKEPRFAARLLNSAKDDLLERYWARNRCTVVLMYFWPGRRTVDGKFGLLGLSGKCWVSMAR